MIKYGVSRDESVPECKECGDRLTKVDGKFVCLSCVQERSYGLDTKVKTAKQPPTRWN